MQSVAPLWDYLYFIQGLVHHFDGRFDEALEAYRRAREVSPGNPAWPFMVVSALLAQGRPEEAESEVVAAGFTEEGHALARLSRAMVAGSRGDAEAVDRLLDRETVAKLEHDLQYCYFMCQAHAPLGRMSEAVSLMQKAARFGHCHWPYFAKVDPLVETLRGTPDFEAALEDVRRIWSALPDRVDAVDPA